MLRSSPGLSKWAWEWALGLGMGLGMRLGMGLGMGLGIRLVSYMYVHTDSLLGIGTIPSESECVSKSQPICIVI